MFEHDYYTKVINGCSVWFNNFFFTIYACKCVGMCKCVRWIFGGKLVANKQHNENWECERRKRCLKLCSKNENKMEMEMEVDNNKTMLQQKLQRALSGLVDVYVFFSLVEDYWTAIKMIKCVINNKKVFFCFFFFFARMRFGCICVIWFWTFK